MRKKNWYIFLCGGYAFRIKCELWYMNKLFEDGAIIEYRQCESKEEAITLSEQYNHKKEKRRYGN